MRPPVLPVHHRTRQRYETETSFSRNRNGALCRPLRQKREIDAMTTHNAPSEVRSANRLRYVRKGKCFKIIGLIDMQVDIQFPFCCNPQEFDPVVHLVHRPSAFVLA